MKLGRVAAIAVLTCSLLLGPGVQESHAADLTLIIELQPWASLNLVTSLLNATVLDAIPVSRTYLIRVNLYPALSNLWRILSGIKLIEPNAKLTLPSFRRFGIVAVAPGAAADWYHNQPAMNLINADDARQIATGQGIVVADIDAIVDYSHPALSGRLTGGYDFVLERSPEGIDLNQSNANFLDQSNANFLDQSNANFLEQSNANFLDGLLNGILTGPFSAQSHGTLVAGMIAAAAPGAMIMPLRTFDDNGNADIFAIAKATRYAADHGAHVINMSFGSHTQSQVFDKAIAYAAERGLVVIASAGNSDSSQRQWPAAYSNVMAIAATTLSDEKASFSNYGGHVFLAAPGQNIISAYPGGLYSVSSGTSFAAPIVAGAAAVLKSRQQGGILNALADGAVNIDGQNPQYQGSLGQGRIDILGALQNQ